jgi:hypothetical protein
MKSANLNFLELTGPLQACNGTALPLPLPKCTGHGVGHRPGLDGCGKSRPQRDSIPGPSSPQRVAITKLFFQSTDITYQLTYSHESSINNGTSMETNEQVTSNIGVSQPTGFDPQFSLAKLSRVGHEARTRTMILHVYFHFINHRNGAFLISIHVS